MGIFNPNRNVWRIEKCARAATLIDAGAYFAALRAALRQARRNVFIIGWDLDSRTRLVGEDNEAHDGWPATLRAFLTRLVGERRDLTVYLLAWDYAVLYASSVSRFLRSSSAGIRPRGSAFGSTMHCRSAPRIIRRSW